MTQSLPLLIFGILVLLLGIAMLVSRLLKSIKNTAKTQGTLIDYKIEETYDSEAGTSTAYYPIIRYVVNGKEYIGTADYGCRGRKEDLGKGITINYNPEHPEEFHVTRQLVSWILPMTVTAVGLFLTMMMIEF